MINPATFKVKLGPVTLRITVGDQDKNGDIDVQIGLRFVDMYEIASPPINIGEALAKAAADALDGARKKLLAGR